MKIYCGTYQNMNDIRAMKDTQAHWVSHKFRGETLSANIETVEYYQFQSKFIE